MPTKLGVNFGDCENSRRSFEFKDLSFYVDSFSIYLENNYGEFPGLKFLDR